MAKRFINTFVKKNAPPPANNKPVYVSMDTKTKVKISEQNKALKSKTTVVV